jgi:hypothetical protein
VIAGSPEASAYPIPTGTRNAASTRPAIVSRASHSRRYERSVDSPGTNRMIGGVTLRFEPTAGQRPRHASVVIEPTRGGSPSVPVTRALDGRSRPARPSLRPARPAPARQAVVARSEDPRLRMTQCVRIASLYGSPIGWSPASSSTPPPLPDRLQTCAWARETPSGRTTSGERRISATCLRACRYPTPLDPLTGLLVRRPAERRRHSA